jgi:hypothetical protein
MNLHVNPIKTDLTGTYANSYRRPLFPRLVTRNKSRYLHFQPLLNCPELESVKKTGFQCTIQKKMVHNLQISWNTRLMYIFV